MPKFATIEHNMHEWVWYLAFCRLKWSKLALLCFALCFSLSRSSCPPLRNVKWKKVMFLFFLSLSGKSYPLQSVSAGAVRQRSWDPGEIRVRWRVRLEKDGLCLKGYVEKGTYQATSTAFTSGDTLQKTSLKPHNFRIAGEQHFGNRKNRFIVPRKLLCSF